MVGSEHQFLPPVPPEHKSVEPYFRRAQEVKTKDPIMAYWCTLYGVERGIASKPQNTQFLSQVVNILEKMKTELAKYEAVTSYEAGSDYVEKFAARVFDQADNEVRKGTATRSTAKKFFASAHFFEVLGVFDPKLKADISEKIRYARWMAVDLAKSSQKENPPLSLVYRGLTLSPASQDGDDAAMVGPSLSNVSAWSPNTSIAPSPATQDQKPLEMSPRPANSPPPPSSVSASELGDAVPPLSSSETFLAATSPEIHEIKSAWPVSPPRTPPSRKHLGTADREAHEMWSNVATPGTPGFDDIEGSREEVNHFPFEKTGSSDSAAEATWDNGDEIEGIAEIEKKLTSLPMASGRVIKRVHFTPSVKGGSSASSSVDGSSPPASPHGDSSRFYAPSLPTVEENSYLTLQEDDGFRELSDDKALPSLPPQMTPSETASSLPSPPVSVPSPLSRPPRPSSSYSVHPSHAITSSSMPPPSPPRTVIATSALPLSEPIRELTTIQISRIQKHCRFAISALDYEDAETARRELRAALHMLGDYGASDM